MTLRLTPFASALALSGLAASAALAAPNASPPGLPAAVVVNPATPAAGHTNPALQTLMTQARSWEGRGRSDLAAAAWRKLLAVDPRHADGLYGLALAQINLGQPKAAAEPIATLRRVRPDHPGLRKLDRYLANGGSDAATLQEARRLAAAGQPDAAARQYELMLSDRTPEGELALEYYQTVGGSAEGWDAARLGLERLARADAAEPRYALAYARHLSYREPSRREAIRRLAALAQPAGAADAPAAAVRPEQRKEAAEAWRQALLWLDARDPDQALYRQYLDSAGDDAALRARLATLTEGSEEARRSAQARERDPAVRSRRQGFDALAAADLSGAAERFTRLLQERPRDADALGGLGVVRLREGRYSEARDLLAKAMAASGGASSPWRTSHQRAQVQALLQQADAARSAQQPEQALELARQASKVDPRDTQAQVAIGDALHELGQWPAAEAQYRQTLAQDGQQPQALRGLLRSLHAQGKVQQGRSQIDSLSDEQIAGLGGRASLQAEQLRLEADGARQRGDTLQAQSLLEDAVRLDPPAAWARLALAQVYVDQGQPDLSQRLMDELVAAPAPRADAWWAYAQWQSQQKLPLLGLQALDRIPAAERTPEMGRLHRRLRVQQQIASAHALAAQNQSGGALAALNQAQVLAGNEPELLGLIGSAHAEAGQSARGLQLLRSALAQDRSRNPALRLQYAQLLQTARQDGELASVLTQLAAQPLSPAMRQQVDELGIGLTLRQVDQQREAGDSAGAYELLAPLLAERPTDSRVTLALARLHAGVGEDAQALQILDDVLLAEPDNLDAWLAAAGTASNLREDDYALAALQRAAQLAPQHPRVLAQYGRYHRARGELGRAADYMRAAIAAQRPQGTPARSLRSGTGLPGVQEPAATWGQPVRSIPAANPNTNPFVPRNSLPAENRRRPPLPSPSTAWLPAEHRPAPLTAAAGVGVSAHPALSASSEAWLRGATADAGLSAAEGRAVAASAQPAPPWWPTPAGAVNRFGTLSAPAAASASAFAGVPAVAFAEPGTAQAVSPPAQRLALPKSLNDELIDIVAERGTRQIEGGAQLRWRSGDPGTSQLVEVRTPVELQLPLGDLGRLSLRLVPTLLDAGAPASDPDNAGLLGTQALGGTPSSATVSASGAAVSIGIEGRHVSADIGSTPLGFPIVNAVGGLRLGGQLASGLGGSVEVSRRAVTDSVLSYAGMKDPRTGQLWGGVLATGLRGSLALEVEGEGRLFAYAGAHALQGQSVKDNTRFELGAGGAWRMVDEPQQRIEAGLQLGYLSHQHNLRHFSFGHGGYFSPQHSLTLAAPLSLIGRRGQLRWSLAATPGLSAWREDGALYYPSDALSQSQLAARASLGLSPHSVYTGRSSVGLSLNLQGGAEYRLSSQLVLGSRIGLDSANDYTQILGGFYLRLHLDPDAGWQRLQAPGPLHD